MSAFLPDESDEPSDLDELYTSSSESTIDTEELERQEMYQKRLERTWLQKELGVKLKTKGFSDVRKVGSGSFCIAVYSAKLAQNDVAVKVCSRETKDSLCTEAEILATMEHPNIIKLVDVVCDMGDYCFVTTELVHGHDFFTLLLNQIDGHTLGDSAVRKGIRIVFKKLLNALCYIHENGGVHNDLKPENLLVGVQSLADCTEETEVKLCDFGLATTETVERHFGGSPEWASPEKLFRNEAATSATDIFSFGLMIYTAGSGRLTFGEESETWPRSMSRTKFVNKLESMRTSIEEATKKKRFKKPNSYLIPFRKEKTMAPVILASTQMYATQRKTAR